MGEPRRAPRQPRRSPARSAASPTRPRVPAGQPAAEPPGLENRRRMKVGMRSGGRRTCRDERWPVLTEVAAQRRIAVATNGVQYRGQLSANRARPDGPAKRIERAPALRSPWRGRTTLRSLKTRCRRLAFEAWRRETSPMRVATGTTVRPLTQIVRRTNSLRPFRADRLAHRLPFRRLTVGDYAHPPRWTIAFERRQ